MKVKFSGKEVSLSEKGGKYVEIVASIQEDEVNIRHDSDIIGGLTYVWVNGKDICVNTDTLKCEVVE